ncbi:hypothetical protein C8J57DRAFT_1238761 [Mycena rebaudengoi]|nr:hypothetical protein C8J57DRAFT_1238761 [Mycena rebaudengoi]
MSSDKSQHERTLETVDILQSVESTVHGTGAEVPARERAVSSQEMNGSLELHRACVKRKEGWPASARSSDEDCGSAEERAGAPKVRLGGCRARVQEKYHTKLYLQK